MPSQTPPADALFVDGPAVQETPSDTALLLEATPLPKPAEIVQITVAPGPDKTPLVVNPAGEVTPLPELATPLAAPTGGSAPPQECSGELCVTNTQALAQKPALVAADLKVASCGSPSTCRSTMQPSLCASAGAGIRTPMQPTSRARLLPPPFCRQVKLWSPKLAGTPAGDSYDPRKADWVSVRNPRARLAMLRLVLFCRDHSFACPARLPQPDPF